MKKNIIFQSSIAILTFSCFLLSTITILRYIQKAPSFDDIFLYIDLSAIIRYIIIAILSLLACILSIILSIKCISKKFNENKINTKIPTTKDRIEALEKEIYELKNRKDDD